MVNNAKYFFIVYWLVYFCEESSYYIYAVCCLFALYLNVGFYEFVKRFFGRGA